MTRRIPLLRPFPSERPFLFGFLLALGGSAACSAPDAPPHLVGEGAPETPLVLPGDPPEAGRLFDDVAWLADDAREGRRAGTAGELASARWIAARFEELGAEPLGSEGYLQAFPVPLPARDEGGSFVAGGDARFEGEKDVVPLFCSSAGTAQGELVFCGYGIVSPDAGWDDFGDADLTGKVCAIVRGTPPRDDLAGDGALFQKVMEGKRRGAAAVIVVQPPGGEESLPSFDSGRGARANVPALMMSAAAFERLLADYARVVEGLDSGADPPGPRPVAQVVRVRADVSRDRGTAYNVLARVPGQGDGTTVVVGAHFDHLGRGGPGSLAPDGTGEIHNGADDNASGTAVCLEMARLWMRDPPAGDVVVALWSGEELGLLGSEYWARAPTMDLSEVAMNVNLDMVGRAESGKLNVLGAGSAAQFVAWLEAAGPRAGLDLQVNLSGQGVGGSDHQTFIKRDIPALHLFTGLHSDYHRPSDDVEGFEAGGAARVAGLALELVARAQAADEIVWTPPQASEEGAQRRGGFKTRFGSVPDYAFGGPGMRLDGTSPRGPAQKAGLLRGDVIYRIDDVDVEGLGEFMYVLNSHKPGDVITVHYIRDGQRESVPLTLESAQAE